MGVDILNPIQTSAWGMAPAALKRDFGEQVILLIDIPPLILYNTCKGRSKKSDQWLALCWFSPAALSDSSMMHPVIIHETTS